MKIQTGEFSSYTNNLIDELGKSKVFLWDLGPEDPVLPEEPIQPVGSMSDPKYNVEMLRYRRALKTYEAELAIYDRNEQDFKNWQRNVRGPVERMMWSCDARDALEHDARAVDEKRQSKRRYYISSRTRGFEKIKNLGLPNGVTPGEGHIENIERQLATEKEFVEVLKKDPQFGDR